MTDITLVKVAGQLVVDSRIIAEQLGIKHKTFIENVRTHKVTIEANFGILPFQTAKPHEGSPGGRPETFVYLNEAQSTFLMTLSRNTPEVIKCKAGLVKAFQEQKKQLEDPADRALLDGLADRIAQVDPWELTEKQVGDVFAMAFAPDPRIAHGLKYVLAHDNLTKVQRSILEDLL
jgi:phage regulator Rha-like protein